MTKNRLTIAALLASTMLTACGGGDEEAATETATPAPATELTLPDAQPDPLVEINARKSEEFLAAERQKDGMRELESGLLIQTLEEGEGETLQEGDIVRFHFSAALMDGTVIQDSNQVGEPLVVPSPVVPALTSWDAIPIPGLPLALAEMREGEKARAVVKPSLAYGEEGVPGRFAPNETLVFEIDLLEVIGDGEEDRRAEVVAEQEALIEEAMAEQKAAEEEARAAYEAAANANAEASAAFLAEVTAQDGVTVTDSGLAYEVLTDGGDGTSPSATDMVTVHYRGTLPDGTEFDSSYSRGEPTSFGLNQVIPGWTEGVALMNVGDKYKFYIPSDLAYGPRGAGQAIGPNQALVFEVELIEVETGADSGGQ